MMKTININLTNLAELIFDNIERAGSTDWDIYINEDNKLDVRHTTHDRDGWYPIFDFYYSYDVEQLGDDRDEAISWLVSDSLDEWKIEEELRNWLPQNGDFEIVFSK